MRDPSLWRRQMCQRCHTYREHNNVNISMYLCSLNLIGEIEISKCNNQKYLRTFQKVFKSARQQTRSSLTGRDFHQYVDQLQTWAWQCAVCQTEGALWLGPVSAITMYGSALCVLRKRARSAALSAGLITAWKN